MATSKRPSKQAFLAQELAAANRRATLAEFAFQALLTGKKPDTTESFRIERDSKHDNVFAEMRLFDCQRAHGGFVTALWQHGKDLHTEVNYLDDLMARVNKNELNFFAANTVQKLYRFREETLSREGIVRSSDLIRQAWQHRIAEGEKRVDWEEALRTPGVYRLKPNSFGFCAVVVVRGLNEASFYVNDNTVDEIKDTPMFKNFYLTDMPIPKQIIP